MNLLKRAPANLTDSDQIQACRGAQGTCEIVPDFGDPRDAKPVTYLWNWP
jgi:hypothetical protein